MTSGIHDSKHAYAPKAHILNMQRKLICVEKQRASLENTWTFFITLNWIDSAVKLYSLPFTFYKVV